MSLDNARYHLQMTTRVARDTTFAQNANTCTLVFCVNAATTTKMSVTILEYYNINYINMYVCTYICAYRSQKYKTAKHSIMNVN